MRKLGRVLLASLPLCLLLASVSRAPIEAASPDAAVSISAVTEGYVNTFTLSVTDGAAGSPLSGYVELSNGPAGATDTDYYVDVAAVPEGQTLPAYGQFGWSDLAANQVSSPFAINGTDTVQVLAYDQEATGDPDSSDAGQSIRVLWSATANGPFTPLTAIPVSPATLMASPSTVTTGTSTPVTFTLTSATGQPLSGFTVAPEQGSGPSGTTNATGSVILTLDPQTSGTAAYFAEDAADNGNNLAGIEYAGPYATATVTETAPSPSPSSSPPERPTVILARSDLPYDALVGQVLADRTHWAVYLTPPTVLLPGIVQTWKADNVGTVVILGGPDAISAGIASEVQALGITVQRIWGADRYGTAAALASYLGDPSGTAIVTGGLTYTDLLSVAAIAGEHNWPILLANASGIPGVEQPVLQALRLRAVYVVGSSATVNQAAVTTLAQDGIQVTRIEGATANDPYGTEAELIKTFKTGLSGHAVYLASAGGFLSGLEESPTIAASESMLIQVPPSGSIPAELAEALSGLRGAVSAVTPVDETVPVEILRTVEAEVGL